VLSVCVVPLFPIVLSAPLCRFLKFALALVLRSEFSQRSIVWTRLRRPHKWIEKKSGGQKRDRAGRRRSQFQSSVIISCASSDLDFRRGLQSKIASRNFAAFGSRFWVQIAKVSCTHSIRATCTLTMLSIFPFPLLLSVLSLVSCSTMSSSSPVNDGRLWLEPQTAATNQHTYTRNNDRAHKQNTQLQTVVEGRRKAESRWRRILGR
jgi:hypothetical protein